METDDTIPAPELRPYSETEEPLLFHWLGTKSQEFSPSAWRVPDVAQIAFVGRVDVAAGCLERLRGKFLSMQIITRPDVPDELALPCMEWLILHLGAVADGMEFHVFPPRIWTEQDRRRLELLGFSDITKLRK